MKGRCLQPGFIESFLPSGSWPLSSRWVLALVVSSFLAARGRAAFDRQDCRRIGCLLPAFSSRLSITSSSATFRRKSVCSFNVRICLPEQRKKISIRSGVDISKSSVKLRTRALLFQRRNDKEYDEDYIVKYGFWNEPLTPTSFNMDLENLAMTDARKAQDVLEIMEEMHELEEDGSDSKDCDESDVSSSSSSSSSGKRISSPLYIKPNSASYTTVINGWLQSGDPDAAHNAQTLLDTMERKYDTTGDESVKPNVVTYMLVCQAWAEHSSRDFDSAERAEKLFWHMIDRGIIPDVRVCTSVLGAWCKRAFRVPGAMRRAEELLTKMEQIVLDEKDVSSNSNRCVNVMSYTSLINGYAKSGERDLARKAESILTRMEENGFNPDILAYCSVLNCWSKCTSRAERSVAARRARSLLDKLERSYLSGKHDEARPTDITYSICINAIANSLEANSAEMAEEILRHMYEIRDGGAIEGLHPTTLVWNSVIVALARSSGRGSRNARRAEQLLKEMTERCEKGEMAVQPDVRTWSGVMLAWAESGSVNAAENAQRVLDTLEESYRTRKTQFRPNTVCYTTVMLAWGNSGKKHAVDKAEALLKRMETLYEEEEDIDVRPNVISYATFLDALAKSGERGSAQKAEDTVERMMRLHAMGHGNVRPNRVVYNALINAWALSGEEEGAKQAENILRRMQKLYGRGHEEVRPDVSTYSSVLNAWARCADKGGAQRAQEILEHMEELHAKGGDIKPNVICYNTVINAWTYSRHKEAPQQAEKLLQRLESQYDAGDDSLHPDVVTYTSVINAASYATGSIDDRREAFQIAMRTYEKLCQSEYEQPNTITYSTMLRAISNLVPIGDSRDQMVGTVFERCCRDGQLSAVVLKQLRKACTSDLYRKLLRQDSSLPTEVELDPDEQMQYVPAKWYENAKRLKRFRI